MKSRGSQCNELLVRAAVRPGKKLGLQSAAKNLQRRRCPYWFRQTVQNRCSSCREGSVNNGGTHSAWCRAATLIRHRMLTTGPHQCQHRLMVAVWPRLMYCRGVWSLSSHTSPTSSPVQTVTVTCWRWQASKRRRHHRVVCLKIHRYVFHAKAA